MKYLSILTILPFLFACSEPSRLTIPAEGSYSIINNWKQITGSKSLDLSSYEISSSSSVNGVVNCNGTYNDSSTLNGVEAGKILISGSFSSGSIQFGNLAYLNGTDSRCENFSGKEFSYDIDATTNILTLCEKPANNCEEYQIQ